MWPFGTCAWRTRLSSGYETLLRTWSTQYEVNERAGRTINAIRERAPHAELRAFMHAVPMDRARVRNLALSSSYVKHGVADIPGFLQALEALLDATSPDDTVVMRYATRAIAWRVYG